MEGVEAGVNAVCLNEQNPNVSYCNFSKTTPQSLNNSSERIGGNEAVVKCTLPPTSSVDVDYPPADIYIIYVVYTSIYISNLLTCAAAQLLYESEM